MNKLVLAHGTSPHVLVSETPIKHNTITLGNQVLDGAFEFIATETTVVKHELVNRANANKREAHHDLVLNPGVTISTIQVEFNPFSAAVQNAVD